MLKIFDRVRFSPSMLETLPQSQLNADASDAPSTKLVELTRSPSLEIFSALRAANTQTLEEACNSLSNMLSGDAYLIATLARVLPRFAETKPEQYCQVFLCVAVVLCEDAPDLAKTALAFLASAGTEGRQTLLDLAHADNPDETSRSMAIRAVGDLREQRYYPWLRDLAHNENESPEIRGAAMVAFAKCIVESDIVTEWNWLLDVTRQDMRKPLYMGASSAAAICYAAKRTVR